MKGKERNEVEDYETCTAEPGFPWRTQRKLTGVVIYVSSLRQNDQYQAGHFTIMEVTMLALKN